MILLHCRLFTLLLPLLLQQQYSSLVMMTTTMTTAEAFQTVAPNNRNPTIKRHILQPTPTVTASSASLDTVKSIGRRTNTPAAYSSSFSFLKATWSNGQAIKEYQDFLSSGQQSIDGDGGDVPSVILSSSNPTASFQQVVDTLVSFGEGYDVVLTPDSKLPETLKDSSSYPIYIALPPMELETFLRNMRKSNEDQAGDYMVDSSWKDRISDFIFISGGSLWGVIEPFIKPFGYARDTMTQLLWNGISLPNGADGTAVKAADLSCKVGIASNGEDKWAGECAVCGKWRGAVKARFEVNEIRCSSAFYREWRRLMWERAAFDAVFNLVGAVRKEPTTIQDVAVYYEEEASNMLLQITSNLRGYLAVTLAYGFEERLFGFAEQPPPASSMIPSPHTTPCELVDVMYPYVFCPPLITSPMIQEYLKYAQEDRGLLQGIALPEISTKPSVMRAPTRADGVI